MKTGISRWILAGSLLFVGYVATFSACSFTVDLDYLKDRGCASDRKFCDPRCVSRADPNFGCGADTCVPCTLPHATANCLNNGLCSIAGCSVGGYKDCDGDARNGCEIDINHDPENCGGCTSNKAGGTSYRCTTPNATPDCAAGRCALRSCNPGWGDCNALATDGCELNLLTDASNCGKCGVSCPSRTCVDGMCL